MEYDGVMNNTLPQQLRNIRVIHDSYSKQIARISVPTNATNHHPVANQFNPHPSRSQTFPIRNEIPHISIPYTNHIVSTHITNTRSKFLPPSTRRTRNQSRHCLLKTEDRIE